MPKKTTLSLPDRLRTGLEQALTAMEDWNQAIANARDREIQKRRPGYYEYRIRTDREHIPMRLGWSQASHWLDLIEDSIRMCGWPPTALYAALGRERPALLPEGPHVEDWHEAQR